MGRRRIFLKTRKWAIYTEVAMTGENMTQVKATVGHFAKADQARFHKRHRFTAFIVAAMLALALASHVSAGDDSPLDTPDGSFGQAVMQPPLITQVAYAKASNTGEDHFFGFSTAASCNTAVIGAIGESSAATGIDGNQDDDSANASGAVYVLAPGQDGNWEQQAYVKASNTSEGYLFGWSVAISGDTLVVGSMLEPSAATGIDGDQDNTDAPGAGAVYVFVRDEQNNWSQQAYIKASNTRPSSIFGASVAISGDTLIVGAPTENSDATGVDGDQHNDDAPSAGAAYVFVRDGAGIWSQQAYLKASNTAKEQFFGTRVAVSGETVAVSAPSESSAATGIDGDQENTDAPEAGAVYVFTRDTGGSWSQQAYIKASNTGQEHFFGGGLALDGDTLAVGAGGESSAATGIGGDQDNTDAPNAGAAYIFARDGAGQWSQQAYIKASNTDQDQGFGSSISFRGERLLVGAVGESSSATGINGDQGNTDAPGAGAAYLFARASSGEWSQQAYIKASNTREYNIFGQSLALSDQILVVGALGEDSSATGIDGNQDQDTDPAPDSGAAYIFASEQVFRDRFQQP